MSSEEDSVLYFDLIAFFLNALNKFKFCCARSTSCKKEIMVNTVQKYCIFIHRNMHGTLLKHTPGLQIRACIEDNSKIIFLVSQQKPVL